MAERRDIETGERRRDRVGDVVEPRVEEHEDEAVVEPYSGASAVANRLVQLVWLVTLVVTGLIAIRLLLLLLGANPGAAFVQFVSTITQPLVAPFAGVFQTIEFAYGGVLEPHAILAIIVYVLVGWLLTRLIWLLFGGERARIGRREVHRRL